MLDGNVLLRQKRDEVPEGPLSCPDQNLADFHHYRHYEGLRLLPTVCDSKLIQQTLIIILFLSFFKMLRKGCGIKKADKNLPVIKHKRQPLDKQKLSKSCLYILSLNVVLKNKTNLQIFFQVF